MELQIIKRAKVQISNYQQKQTVIYYYIKITNLHPQKNNIHKKRGTTQNKSFFMQILLSIYYTTTCKLSLKNKQV